MMRIHFCLANLISPLTAYCFPHENLVRSTNHNTTTTAFHGTRLDLSPVLLFLFHLAAIALSIEADRCSMHGWMAGCIPSHSRKAALRNPPPFYNPRNPHFCSTPNSRDFYFVLPPNPNGARHLQRSHIIIYWSQQIHQDSTSTLAKRNKFQHCLEHC
jgi:hypothetical protein